MPIPCQTRRLCLQAVMQIGCQIETQRGRGQCVHGLLQLRKNPHVLLAYGAQRQAVRRPDRPTSHLWEDRSWCDPSFMIHAGSQGKPRAGDARFNDSQGHIQHLGDFVVRHLLNLTQQEHRALIDRQLGQCGL